jgi:uncharacterized protein (TIGR02246 family)
LLNEDAPTITSAKWPRVFVQHFNTGDLDPVMSLYEPDAGFVTRTGETLIGQDAIRKALSAMIDVKMQFHSRVARATIVGDIAQLYTDFEGTRVDNSGKSVPVQAKAIESFTASARWQLEANHGRSKWARIKKKGLRIYICDGAALRRFK